MNLKLFFLVPLIALTACTTVKQDPVHNPQGLNNDELIKAQIARIEKLEREMERRETELKFQHLKELTQVQTQTKAAHTVNTNCKFICF